MSKPPTGTSGFFSFTQEGRVLVKALGLGQGAANPIGDDRDDLPTICTAKGTKLKSTVPINLGAAMKIHFQKVFR